MVTLTGVGGVGKTRLALQSAAEVLPHFRDGAWLAELASADSPEALVQVVATELRVSSHPTIPLDDPNTRLRSATINSCSCSTTASTSSMPPTRLADGILRECPSVRILATSRESLDVDGERVVRVRSLPLPDPSTDAEGAEAADAVRLFVERAGGAEPDFRLDARDLQVVVEICTRLDGIPLAIELAAARVVSMSPAEIAGLLDERFRLLTGGRRTAVERHQTLRATVDWSYSLLQPAERAVFDRLGVFPASFDAAAARAVAQGDGVEDWDVRDALTSLVNKSMVNTASGATGTTRYQLLETMRQYSRERLDQTGDADQRRRAHAEYYAQLADDYGDAMLTGHDIQRRHSEVRFEWDNYRAAVTWALDSLLPGDGDLALRIAVPMAGAATGVRRAAGLIARTDRLLQQAESSAPALRAAVLAGMANDALMLRGDVLARPTSRAGRSTAGQHPWPGLALSYADAQYLRHSRWAVRARARDPLGRASARPRRSVRTTATTSAFYELQIARVEGTRGDRSAARLHARRRYGSRGKRSLPCVSPRRSPAWPRAAATTTSRARAGLQTKRSPRRASQGSRAHSAPRSCAKPSSPVLRVRCATQSQLLRAAAVAWADDISSIVVVSTAARAVAIFASGDDLGAAAVLGGFATAGMVSHLLLATVDPTARDEPARRHWTALARASATRSSTPRPREARRCRATSSSSSSARRQTRRSASDFEHRKVT